MTDSTDRQDAEGFAELDRLATELFETHRWKAAFARRYGVTVQGIQNWRQIGPQPWALVAVRDAIAAKELDRLRKLLAG